jgi:predicted nucleotidyltransferase
MQSLVDIEAEHDVTVLYACESGSRGWGFASPDSDYDVRFLYVHRLPWYLAVEPKRDVIELPISDELDVGGWELRKALRLLRRANPVLLEWLDSPVVYREDTALTAGIRDLATHWFSPLRGRYHYLAMARRNFREHLQGDSVRLKKYLYVLRPLLAAQWIERGLGQPPMRFADLAERLVTDTALLDEITPCWKSRCAPARPNTARAGRAFTLSSKANWRGPWLTPITRSRKATRPNSTPS